MKWIKHDTDANQDAKLQNVMLDYGLEGYGLYWYCIELIAGKVDKDNITFDLEHDARIIARNTGSTPQKVEEMMKYFVKIELFENSSGAITCFKLAKRLDKSMTSNVEMRSIIQGFNVNKTQLDGYVYFIEKRDSRKSAIAIKIGRSKNPQSRLAEISKLSDNIGFKLEIIHTIHSENCVQLETELHRRFSEFCIYNEWFEPSKAIYETLRSDYDLIKSDKPMQDKNRLEEKRIDQTRVDKIKDLPAIAEEFVFKLPTNKLDVFYLVTIEEINNYKSTYQAVDINQQYKAIISWLSTNSRNRKTKSGMPRFINSWLSKAQNSAPRVDQPQQRPVSKTEFFK